MDPVSIAAIGGAVAGLVTDIVNAANPPPSAVVTYQMPGQRKNQTFATIGIFFFLVLLVIVVPKIFKR
jgi:hypothetical protein